MKILYKSMLIGATCSWLYAVCTTDRDLMWLAYAFVCISIIGLKQEINSSEYKQHKK